MQQMPDNTQRDADAVVAKRSEELPGDAGNGPSTPPPKKNADKALIERVEALRTLESRRSHYFDSDLFSDHGWSVMLNLYHGHLIGRAISVSSACTNTGMSSATALRWVSLLAKRGVVVTYSDSEDPLRMLVRLSDRALAAMHALLGGAMAGL